MCFFCSWFDLKPISLYILYFWNFHLYHNDEKSIQTTARTYSKNNEYWSNLVRCFHDFFLTRLGTSQENNEPNWRIILFFWVFKVLVCMLVIMTMLMLLSTNMKTLRPHNKTNNCPIWFIFLKRLNLIEYGTNEWINEPN